MSQKSVSAPDEIREQRCSPRRGRKRYSLSELLAECDEKTPVPEAMKIWEAVPPTGQESL